MYGFDPSVGDIFFHWGDFVDYPIGHSARWNRSRPGFVWQIIRINRLLFPVPHSTASTFVPVVFQCGKWIFNPFDIPISSVRVKDGDQIARLFLPGLVDFPFAPIDGAFLVLGRLDLYVPLNVVPDNHDVGLASARSVGGVRYGLVSE